MESGSTSIPIRRGPSDGSRANATHKIEVVDVRRTVGCGTTRRPRHAFDRDSPRLEEDGHVVGEIVAEHRYIESAEAHAGTHGQITCRLDARQRAVEK